jgi:hypothetical protein
VSVLTVREVRQVTLASRLAEAAETAALNAYWATVNTTPVCSNADICDCQYSGTNGY